MARDGKGVTIYELYQNFKFVPLKTSETNCVLLKTSNK
jgi:hypothetical protein